MKNWFKSKRLLPFFLIIGVLMILLVVSLYLSNSGALSRDAGYSQDGVELNEVLVKVLLKDGETFDKQIQINPKYSDKNWLLTGEIDKTVYFVLKNTKKDYLNQYPDIEILYEKNGFVFCIREPLN